MGSDTRTMADADVCGVPEPPSQLTRLSAAIPIAAPYAAIRAYIYSTLMPERFADFRLKYMLTASTQKARNPQGDSTNSPARESLSQALSGSPELDFLSRGAPIRGESEQRPGCRESCSNDIAAWNSETGDSLTRCHTPQAERTASVVADDQALTVGTEDQSLDWQRRCA
jgi:hypothetical protein